MDTPGKNPAFTSTQWSTVLRARGDSPFAAECLEKLCATYWYPLYAFLRQQGHTKERAEDLTQGFFEQLLAKKFLENIHPSKGKFRNFLLASLKNYTANERDKEFAQKRGGGSITISIDGIDPEARYGLEPVTTLSPDKLFDRSWANTVLEKTYQELRQNMEGREAWFEPLKPLLIGEPSEIPYRNLAETLGTTENALKTYVSRFRKKFQNSLREVISCTVERPEQVEEEVRELVLALQ